MNISTRRGDGFLPKRLLARFATCWVDKMRASGEIPQLLQPLGECFFLFGG